MPEGIITRLIVRLNALIAEEQGIDLVWRKGVVLEQNDCRALIREEDNRDGLKVINIAVTGIVNERKFLLRKIREEIQEIHHKWFKNIQAEQMIPCNCNYCSDMTHTNPKYFQLSVLERASERGKSSIECNNDFLDVSVSGLLEGVFDDAELAKLEKFGFERRERVMDKEAKGDGTNVTYIIENVGALGGVGDQHKVSGKIILNKSERKVVEDLQGSLTELMKHVENYQADFKIKMEAYSELVEINKHLANLENLTPKTKSKLHKLLGDIKDGTLGAVKLAGELKDGSEAVYWVIEKAVSTASVVLDIIQKI